MLKKLQLDQTKAYEICIATEKIAHMLVAFVQGRAHTLTIGCEQGDIIKWDDLILELCDGTLEHIQVKRNFSDFDKHNCDRATDPITRGKNLGKLRDLSPLDETIKALADWTKVNDPTTSAPKRKFSIAVPSMDTLIKKDIQVRHLYEFCREITASTTATRLTTLAAAHPPTANIFLWLNTWCDFQDWNHIIKAFRCFEICHVGTETEIERRTDEYLSLSFNNAEAVRKEIHTFICDNSTYTSAITPRPLFGAVKRYWVTGAPRWTQYVNEGSQWNISGIHDDDFNEIEKPERVVQGMWQADGSAIVKVHGKEPDDNLMPVSIMRLILHLPHPAVAHVHNSLIWQQKTKQYIGGTLGTGEEDCQALPLLESNSLNQSSDTRSLSRLDDIDSEGKKLTDCMDSVTWELILAKVDELIRSLAASDLRVAIETRWQFWKRRLAGDCVQQTSLCREMLHPEAEGEEILSTLRLGPRTVLLISKGILLLLTIAVALSDIDEGWEVVGNGLTVKNRALTYWSGPAGKKRKVRLLTDDGVSSLIGKESAKILILSGIASTTSEIKDSSLAEGTNNSYTLASPHEPLLLVTNSMKLKWLIGRGDLLGIKDYIQQELEKAKITRENQIRAITP